jgi:hypothetical protein
VPFGRVVVALGRRQSQEGWVGAYDALEFEFTADPREVVRQPG